MQKTIFTDLWKMLEQPVSYQGSKRRYAKDIIRYIQPNNKFADFCCGTGTVSMAALNYLNPKDITMVDFGPWGNFWELVGSGEFSLNKFKKFLKEMPQEQFLQDYLEELASTKPKEGDIPYIFLLLQAGSFGGKAIWVENGEWKHQGFRREMRRTGIRTFFPRKRELYKRVARICNQMYGVTGLHKDVREIEVESSVVYIDPPYKEGSGYKGSFDISLLVKSLVEKDNKVFVSEETPLSNNYIILDTGSRRSNISGKARKKRQEFLSVYYPNQ